CRKLPVLHIFGQQPLDIGRCAEAFRELYPNRQSRVVVLSDVVYAHAMDDLEQQLCPEYPDIIFSRVVCGDAPGPTPPGEVRQFGRQFQVKTPGGLQDYAMFYVGAEGLALTNFMLSSPRAGGKPTPAKLANFLEVDIFVLVACAQNSLLDSSDFYRPVVTPYELELACNPAREWTGNYLTDFRDLLPARLPPAPALACRDQTRALAEISPAASFLESRSWRGLEQQLGQTPISKAVQGRRGIAIAYEDEGREQP
ncbi:PREDICTED: diphthamide biosynthesis protein 2, partial [Apaloderma vittatum]|uniref:diphthamide biosynthesis protein 2 n=1 Tax=Apaloderma vittatum TaxID=57397 RepID=UPI0005213E6D